MPPPFNQSARWAVIEAVLSMSRPEEWREAPDSKSKESFARAIIDWHARSRALSPGGGVSMHGWLAWLLAILAGIAATAAD